MKKKVALDIGNVLIDVDLDVFIRKIYQLPVKFRYSPKYFLENLQHFQDLGLVNLDRALRDWTDFGIHQQQAINFWLETVQVNDQMKDWAWDLAQSGVEIAYLSNIGPDHLDWWKKQGYPPGVEHYSCEVGARKPTKIYFQSFLQERPDFRSHWYIDDLSANLAMGEKLGFKTLHFSLEENKKLPLEQQEKNLSKMKRIILGIS